MTENYLDANLSQQGQPSHLSASTEIASTRAAQEVQAAMVIAAKFPRDEMRCIQNIINACGRLRLAETAQYSYKRGGTLIEGPSIRLAETIAQRWKNFDFGVVELERTQGESQCMSYAWDLENNVRRTMIFSIRHWRDTKSGGYALKDERDIYELIANMGSRRLRACILSVIPGDVVEEAQEACNNTLIEAEKGVPIEQRREKMVAAFDAQGVSEQQLTNFLGHAVGAATLNELVRLRKIFTTIKDGISTKGEFFPPVEGGSTKKKAADPRGESQADDEIPMKTAPAKKKTAKVSKTKKPDPEPEPKTEKPEPSNEEAKSDIAEEKAEPEPEAEAEAPQKAKVTANGELDLAEPGEVHHDRCEEISRRLNNRKFKVADFEMILQQNAMLAEGAGWRDLPVEVLDDILSAWETMVELLVKAAQQG